MEGWGFAPADLLKLAASQPARCCRPWKLIRALAVLFYFFLERPRDGVERWANDVGLVKRRNFLRMLENGCLSLAP